MYPTLVHLGWVTISSLWVCIAIGFFQAFLLFHKQIQKDREKLTFLANHSLLLFLGAILMARLVYVFKNYPLYLGVIDTEHIINLFNIVDKGLSFWGGVFGFFLTLAFFCWKEKENFFEWLDVFIPALFGGMFFGNIGLLLDGRNYGNETNLPWGVVIESSRFAVPIHPTQLYAALYCLLITLLLLQFAKTKTARVPGNTAFLGISIYSLFKFLEEFLRGDESNYILGLREVQFYCIFVFIFSTIILYLQLKKNTSLLPS